MRRRKKKLLAPFKIDSRSKINVAIFAFNWINIIINWNSCYINMLLNEKFLSFFHARKAKNWLRYAATLFAFVNWNCMLHLQDAPSPAISSLAMTFFPQCCVANCENKRRKSHVAFLQFSFFSIVPLLIMCSVFTFKLNFICCSNDNQLTKKIKIKQFPFFCNIVIQSELHRDSHESLFLLL